MTSSFPLFTGNCPRSVNKDAKYVIRSGPSGPVVTLTYVTADGERWLATTERHPELVQIVNAVKTTLGNAPNGQFYINEFGQVIVPVGSDVIYYLAADHYDMPLSFQFEGNVLSGEGVDLRGRPLRPGEVWSGPHPGIPYVVKPGLSDIYFRSHPRPYVTKQVLLSSVVGRNAATSMAQRIGSVKGWSGGRFYVNEWKEIFAPVNESTGLEFRYIGRLEDDDPWFAKPTA